MTTTTSFWTRIERQERFHQLLESFGVTYYSSIGPLAENAYTKQNAAGQVMTIVSDDIDVRDVMEGEEPIEGMTVESDWVSTGIGEPIYYIRRVRFE